MYVNTYWHKLKVVSIIYAFSCIFICMYITFYAIFSFKI